MTEKSASIAVHVPANDERQMQLQKVLSDDKTHFRKRLHHLVNKYVMRREIHLSEMLRDLLADGQTLYEC